MNFFSKVKNKIQDTAVTTLIRSKMKSLPKEQQDMMIAMVSKNPDFFKKMQEQIEAKKKAGQNEQMAAMQVMRENQAELQKMMMDLHTK